MKIPNLFEILNILDSYKIKIGDIKPMSANKILFLSNMILLVLFR